MAAQKTFLFLQGHHSFFWVRLGDALKAQGHRVLKVRISGQDVVFWPRRGAVSYRGRKAGWRGWLEEFIAREGVTDVLYYADRHPWNVDALAASKAAGVRAWTMEFGYLRPDWLTLEPEAMGAFSRFPKDPEAIRALGCADGPDPMAGEAVYPSGFIHEALADIGMYASTIAFWPVYPHYRLDAKFDMFTHYFYWLRTLFTEKRQDREARVVEAACQAPGADYTLVAMQVPHDYQIRASSPYDDYRVMIREILASMARSAPVERRLVLKMHPLDEDYLDWRSLIPIWVKEFGLEGRVDLVRGGDLGAMIDHAKGVIMANSTVGMHSIRRGVPTLALGDAIYDVPGLTHQAGIDTFWTDPAPVDQELAAVFLRVVAAEIQIKGSFFNRNGQRNAVREVVERLTRRAYPAWAD